MKTFRIILDIDTRELFCASRAVTAYTRRIQSSGFAVDLYVRNEPQNRIFYGHQHFRDVILGIPSREEDPEIYSGNHRLIKEVPVYRPSLNRREAYCRCLSVPIYEDYPDIFNKEDISITKAVELVAHQRETGHHKNTAQHLLFSFSKIIHGALFEKTSTFIAKRNSIMSFRIDCEKIDPWVLAWWMVNSFIIITNESWLSHLAAALHTPTIVIDNENEKEYHYALPHMHYLAAREVFAEDVIQLIDKIL